MNLTKNFFYEFNENVCEFSSRKSRYCEFKEKLYELKPQRN